MENKDTVLKTKTQDWRFFSCQ